MLNGHKFLLAPVGTSEVKDINDKIKLSLMSMILCMSYTIMLNCGFN